MIKSIFITVIAWSLMIALVEGFEIDSRPLLLLIGFIAGVISLMVDVTWE